MVIENMPQAYLHMKIPPLEPLRAITNDHRNDRIATIIVVGNKGKLLILTSLVIFLALALTDWGSSFGA